MDQGKSYAGRAGGEDGTKEMSHRTPLTSCLLPSAQARAAGPWMPNGSFAHPLADARVAFERKIS